MVVRPMVKPISPEEIGFYKKKILPQEVIETFNELIAKNYCNGTSRINQQEIITSLSVKGISRQDIFNNKYLDVEPIYEAEGWEVEYDKPDYTESYDPVFIFRSKR